MKVTLDDGRELPADENGRVDLPEDYTGGVSLNLKSRRDYMVLPHCKEPNAKKIPRSQRIPHLKRGGLR